MPSTEFPQLCYLNDAAGLVARTSPSTAAHLLAAHTQFLHEDYKSLNVRQQKHHCAACGSIRQSRNTKSTEVRRKGQSRASKLELPGGAKIYKCLRCHRRAVFPRKRTFSKLSSRVPPATAFPKKPTLPSLPTSTKESSQPDSPSSASESQPPKSAENANSKKRAKARKQGGLQALLASKQQRSQPSLDLFDFLQ